MQHSSYSELKTVNLILHKDKDNVRMKPDYRIFEPKWRFLNIIWCFFQALFFQ